MKTLLKENKFSIRWYPNLINTLRDQIIVDKSVAGGKELLDNIAYNIQYLEYLQKQLDELKLSEVMGKMIYKTYIITGMGVVEGLFTNVLKSNNQWRTSVWESVGLLQSNPTKIDGKDVLVKTEILKKVEKYDERMDLDSMMKKIERKKLLSLEHSDYPVLKQLRNLRNHIHLQQANDRFDTDYHNFDIEKKKMMGKILHSILTDELFLKDEKKIYIYDFLLLE